jgi:hypothetical protein
MSWELVTVGMRALLYRLLYDALIEIRYDAHEGLTKEVFRLADLFHNLPMQLERMQRGETTPEEVMSDLRAHAERIGAKQWLAHRIQEDMSHP